MEVLLILSKNDYGAQLLDAVSKNDPMVRGSWKYCSSLVRTTVVHSSWELTMRTTRAWCKAHERGKQAQSQHDSQLLKMVGKAGNS
eukprot:1143627-Pelagomonas_calceolata.AAC.3